MENEMDLKEVYDYALAGKAELIFTNVHTGNMSTTFTVKNHKIQPVWFVNTPTMYIGYIRGDIFIPIPDWKEFCEKDVQSFQYVWKRIVNRGPINLDEKKFAVMHTGICSVCGQRLTDGESVRLGIGPICRKKLR